MEFRILGPLEIIIRGNRLRVADSREQRILAMLLLEPAHVVPLDRLVAAAWDDQPPPSATKLVRNGVSMLRRRLSEANAAGQLIATHPAGYSLHVPPQQIDLVVFEDRVARGRQLVSTDQLEPAVACLREALALWRGVPLAGVTGRVIQGAATRLAEQRLTVQEECLSHELALGRGPLLVDELAALAAAHPLRERLQAQLMLAMYRSGRRGDALDVYRRARQVMVQELGIEPGTELAELHHAILSGDSRLDVAIPPPGPQPAATTAPRLGPPSRSAPPAERTALRPPTGTQVAAVPRLLPRRVPQFVGRICELSTLDELAGASNGKPFTVTIGAIVGTGGVGKTALALQWAHSRAERYPDGQLYVNLRGYDLGEPLRPLDALARLLIALGVPAEKIPADEDGAAGLYRSLLAYRRMLIVLDNARSVEQVRPLLPGVGADNGLVLVTSRDTLAGLVALDDAHLVRLNALDDGESQALLAHLLGDERAGREPRAVAHLAERCGRLPLALRLAAANLAVHPNRTLADQVSAIDAGALDALRIDGDPHSTLRRVFDSSYRTLGDDDRRVFRLLGLVPGPDFTPAVATALAGITAASAGTAIEHLVAAHLVISSAPGRFQFHDLLRVYAHEQAHADAPEVGKAVGRLHAFYLGHIDAAARLLYPNISRLAGGVGAAVRFPTGAAALAWLDDELRGLMDAIRHSTEQGRHEMAWLLADGLRGYFVLRSNLVDWRAAALAGLSAAVAARDRQARAAAHISLGLVAKAQGDSARSMWHHRTALGLARSVGWAEAEANAVFNLATVVLNLGRLELAAGHFGQAMATYRRLDDSLGTTSVLVNLGIVELRSGRLRLAADHLAEAVVSARRLGSGDLLAPALHSLAVTHHQRGEVELAMATLEESHVTYAGSGNIARAALVRANQAAFQAEAGRPDLALPLARDASAVLHELGMQTEEAYAVTAVGLTETALARYGEAEQHLTTAVDLALSVTSRHAELTARLRLAELYCADGRPDRAIEEAEIVLAAARADGYRIFEGDALTVLAEACLSMSDSDRAGAWARQAATIHRGTGARRGLARTAAILTRLGPGPPTGGSVSDNRPTAPGTG